MADLLEQYARPRALEFNVGEGEERNDTGVRFEDVAGIDRIKSNIIEVIKMLRGDEHYMRIGAKPPKVLSRILIEIVCEGSFRESCWRDRLVQERPI